MPTRLKTGSVAERLAARGDVALEAPVRPPGRPGWPVLDFEALVANPLAGGAAAVDVGVSCLGTTRAKAGSDAAFRRVDLDYVVAFARAARARGARRFLLVSSVGAGGRGLYLAAKGEAEEAVRGVGFDRLDIVRPSLLIGGRADRRPAERLAQAFAPALAPLLRGLLARYAALDAVIVAAAIERLVTGRASPGVHVHFVPDLLELARAARGG